MIHPSPEQEQEAETVVRWAAARGGVLVVIPLVGGMALLANQIYMVNRLGQVYGQDLAVSSAKGFVMAFAGALVGQTLAALVPLPFVQIPVAVTVTYAVGKAADAWLRDGMPQDFERYRRIFERAKDFAKQNLGSIKDDPRKDQPLGDESKKF